MRRRKAKIRKLKPDSKYNSVLITKLINYVMVDGKKSVARKIVYSCFNKISKKGFKNPLGFFEEVIEQIKPTFEVRSRRVGGANYQIPTEVREERRLTLALRWLLEAARSKRVNTTFSNVLVEELLQVKEGKGLSLKKKRDVHKMAESNKSFSHFRF